MEFSQLLQHCLVPGAAGRQAEEEVLKLQHLDKASRMKKEGLVATWTLLVVKKGLIMAKNG